jgi:hypothetical protein
MKEHKMGGACSAHEGEEKCTRNSLWQARREDTAIDGKIILKLQVIAFWDTAQCSLFEVYRSFRSA